MQHLPIVLIGLFFLAVAGGCRTHPTGNVDEREAPARALLGSPEARAVPVVRGDDGAAMSWSDLVARVSRADVVLIGELHGHPLGSAAAAAMWEDVLAFPGVAERAALSMEFFERDEQSQIDDYVTGLIDEPAMLKKGDRDSYVAYPFGHRAMVNEAKARSVPVVAANSPRVYVRTARLDGYERLAGLTEEQRRMFRVPDRVPGPETRYHQKFREFMLGPGGHGEAAAGQPSAEDLARVEAGLRAQSLWDWTMAESVSRAASRGRHPVVHVVGQFHMLHEGGMVLALRAMDPGLKVLTVAFMGEDSRSLREEDRGAADVVVYTGGEAGASTADR